MKRLYSRNLNVAYQTAQLIKDCNVIKFKKQVALYLLIEDIKYPFLKAQRNYFRKKSPAYMPNHNYDPVIDHLCHYGILRKNRLTKFVEFSIDKNELNLYLENYKKHHNSL